MDLHGLGQSILQKCGDLSFRIGAVHGNDQCCCNNAQQSISAFQKITTSRFVIKYIITKCKSKNVKQDTGLNMNFSFYIFHFEFFIFYGVFGLVESVPANFFLFLLSHLLHYALMHVGSPLNVLPVAGPEFHSGQS